MSLSAYLKDQGLTYNDFGQQIGVTGISIYRYLTGKRFPKRSIMSKIIAVTGGQVGYDDFPELKKYKSKKPKKLT